MGHAWQLQEAKNKLSNLVKRAQKEGPQVITKHGKDAVVVMSVEDYKKMTKPKSDLVNFLQESPLHGQELDVSRDKSAPRDVSI